jgi:hypothetical protein
MTLVAAAVCPHPPLLIPEVGCGVDLDSREAAREAVRRLVATEPDLVVIVGADVRTARYDADAAGSFAAYGVGLVIPLGPGQVEPSGGPTDLPLSLTVGAWLLRGAGWTGEREALGLAPGMSVVDAAALGVDVARRRDRVALLCMGDGSARRTVKAPGWLDHRADAFDRNTAEALATGDPHRLAAVGRQLADELLVAGWSSWQVLAGAAAGTDWSAELLTDEAPFGVGYHVACWLPREVPVHTAA